MCGRYVFFIRHNLEAIIWISALVALALGDPANHHYTLCPFNNLGLDFCPGCGLGRSVSFLFRGNFADSFKCHPLGIFAVVILVHRSVTVFRATLKNYRVITGKPFQL